MHRVLSLVGRVSALGGASLLLACSTILGEFTESGAGGTNATGATAGSGGSSVGSGGATAGSGGAMAGCAACSPNATCSNEQCACKPGFVGDGKTCNDVDECSMNPQACGANENCLNTNGSFQCSCVEGFVKVGSTCVAIWEQVAGLQGAAFGEFGSFVASGATRVFLANNSQTEPFFFSFDANSPGFTKEVAPPKATNDFCACGFRAATAVASDVLFEFGNFGQFYTGGVWKSVSATYEVTMRGEASAAAVGKVIFILGGRDDTNQDQPTMFTYNAAVNTFTKPFTEYPYGPVSEAAMASFKELVFVTGGSVQNDKTGRLSALFDSGTNKWAKLPDAPIAVFRGDAVGFQEQFLVSNGTAIATFDLGAMAWLKSTFAFPTGGTSWRLAATAKDVWAFGNFGTNLHAYRLNVKPQ